MLADTDGQRAKTNWRPIFARRPFGARIADNCNFGQIESHRPRARQAALTATAPSSEGPASQPASRRHNQLDRDALLAAPDLGAALGPKTKQIFARLPSLQHSAAARRPTDSRLARWQLQSDTLQLGFRFQRGCSCAGACDGALICINHPGCPLAGSYNNKSAPASQSAADIVVADQPARGL